MYDVHDIHSYRGIHVHDVEYVYHRYRYGTDNTCHTYTVCTKFNAKFLELSIDQ